MNSKYVWDKPGMWIKFERAKWKTQDTECQNIVLDSEDVPGLQHKRSAAFIASELAMLKSKALT